MYDLITGEGERPQVGAVHGEENVGVVVEDLELWEYGEESVPH